MSTRRSVLHGEKNQRLILELSTRCSTDMAPRSDDQSVGMRGKAKGMPMHATHAIWSMIGRRKRKGRTETRPAKTTCGACREEVEMEQRWDEKGWQGRERRGRKAGSARGPETGPVPLRAGCAGHDLGGPWCEREITLPTNLSTSLPRSPPWCHDADELHPCEVEPRGCLLGLTPVPGVPGCQS